MYKSPGYMLYVVMYRDAVRDTSADQILAEGIVADNAAFAVPEPDGERIAFAQTRENRTDLWLHTSDGRDHRLTGTGVLAAPEVYPFNNIEPFQWHPDGGALVYSSNASGSLDIWTVNVDTGEKTRLTYHSEPDTHPRFGPSGSEVAYVTSHRSPGTIAISDREGTKTHILRTDDYLYDDPQWKDDDTLYAIRTAHTDIYDGNCDVVRLTRDGDCEIVFSEPDVSAIAPRVRPESDEVAFIHDGTGYDSLYVTGPRTSDPEELYAAEGTELSAPTWNEDGDLLVVAAESGETKILRVSRDGDATALTDGRARRYFPQWKGENVIAVTGTPAKAFGVVGVTNGVRVTDGSVRGLSRRFVEPRSVTYEAVDGVEIQAMLYLPEDVEDRDRNELPVLVHPHGGPQFFYGYDYNPIAQYFVAQGYALIEPNYRGSAGFGRRFRDMNDMQWGEEDLQDVVTSVDFVDNEYAAVDGSRAGIFGGSGGGLMTVNALGKSDRFDAGAAFYGVFDYETFVDDTDDIGWQLMKRELGYPATDIENYRDASPIQSVPDIDAPLLLLHGENDLRVPISQSEQLADELEKHGKTYEFVRYENERHVLTRRENVMDAFTRVADLFAKYLQEDPDAGGSSPHVPDEDRNSKVPLAPFTHFH
ncbi:MAG: LpqB family beta-propeller domain-containing protein [Halorhabdus sp.]